MGKYFYGGMHGKVTSLKAYFGTGGKCKIHHVLEGIHIEFDYGTMKKVYGSPGFCNSRQYVFCRVRLDLEEHFNYVEVTYYDYVSKLEFHTNFGEFYILHFF